MKFTSMIAGAFCLAATAFASPIAAPVTNEASNDVSLPDVQGVSPGLLAKLAPGVGLLVTGLGLGVLAPPLVGLLGSLSIGLKREAVPTALLADINLPGASDLQKENVIQGVQTLVTTLHMDDDSEVEGMAADLLTKVKGLVTQILTKLNLQSLLGGVAGKRQVPEVPEVPGGANPGLLALIAVPLAGLVTALGLGSLAPGLLAVLTTLSTGL